MSRTELVQKRVHVWRHIYAFSGCRFLLPELIRARDRIDLLVDLKSAHRPEHASWCFARKPAPVQVTWLGYPGTTGLATIDYRLSDPHLDPIPEECRPVVRGKVDSPPRFVSGATSTLDPGPAPREGSAASAIKRAIITFGCLNNYCKISTTRCLRTLVQKSCIASPGSQLVLALTAEASPPPARPADMLDSMQDVNHSGSHANLSCFAHDRST